MCNIALCYPAKHLTNSFPDAFLRACQLRCLSTGSGCRYILQQSQQHSCHHRDNVAKSTWNIQHTLRIPSFGFFRLGLGKVLAKLHIILSVASLDITLLLRLLEPHVQESCASQHVVLVHFHVHDFFETLKAHLPKHVKRIRHIRIVYCMLYEDDEAGTNLSLDLVILLVFKLSDEVFNHIILNLEQIGRIDAYNVF